MGTFLGVPIIRIIVFWGLYWGPLILGNYHMKEEGLGFGLRGLRFRVATLNANKPSWLHSLLSTLNSES